MTSWNCVAEHNEPHAHYVQFYKADEPLLNRNVGHYLWEGFLRGEGLIVVATPERRESLTGHLRRLGVDVEAARKERQLVLLDAGETLARFMVEGSPDHNLFQQAMSDAIQMVAPRDNGLRVYGEMVGVLWTADQFEAAIRLEEYWNELLHVTGITLFCGYPIDVFSREIENGNFEAILSAHTHALPAGADGGMTQAVDQAINDVLGSKAEELRVAMVAKSAPHHASMPTPETTILWLRRNFPDRAEGILSRAREYYEVASQAAQEPLFASHAAA